jgi:hypothetical protein
VCRNAQTLRVRIACTAVIAAADARAAAAARSDVTIATVAAATSIMISTVAYSPLHARSCSLSRSSNNRLSTAEESVRLLLLQLLLLRLRLRLGPPMSPYEALWAIWAHMCLHGPHWPTRAHLGPYTYMTHNGPTMGPECPPNRERQKIAFNAPRLDLDRSDDT